MVKSQAVPTLANSEPDAFHSWREARAWLHGRRAVAVVTVRVWVDSTRGEEAGVIAGYRLDYAVVGLPDGRSVEYAWGSVASAVRDGTCLFA